MRKAFRETVNACRIACTTALRWFSHTRRKRENRLSTLIGKERKRLQGYSVWHRLKSTVTNAYFPSTKSIAAVVVVLGIALTVILYIDRITAQAATPVLARLTTIETGIALIFIPVTIFVVGLSSRRSSSGVTVAEILLRRVYLFPLTILIMGIVVSFSVITSAGVALFFIAITLLLSGYCIFQVIRLLLDEQSLRRGGIQLLQDVVRRSINLALDERIGKNLEIKALEDLPIDYSPFGLGEDPMTTYTIHATDEGFIQDVFLDRLRDFAVELERFANSNGFAYEEKRVLESEGGAEESTVGHANIRELEVENRRSLKKLYADQITNDSNVLITFPRKLVPDEADRQRLSEIARSAFKIKPRVSYSERISGYLGEVKDEAILALRDKRTYNLESLLEAHVSVAQTFLTEMQNAGGGYSFEQAQREEAALLSRGWDEVKWISEDLAEIHRIGCRSGDMKVVTLVASAPYHIAYAAIRARDHLLFREFTPFPVRLYDAALVEKAGTMREYLVDRAWRHLRELGNFGVQMELRRTITPDGSIVALTDFGTTLLMRFQDLLRASFNSKELRDFQLFKRATIQLFETLLGAQLTRTNTELLRARLLQLDLANEEQKNLRNHLRRQELLEDAYKEFRRRKSQMFFSLGSHIFRKHVAKPSNREVSSFLGEINELLPADASDLTELYTSFVDQGLQSIWGWEWWDTPQEGPWMGDPYEKITQYYCFQLAKVCEGLSTERIIGLSFPRTGFFLNQVAATGSVATTMKSFLNDRDKWHAIVPDLWLGGVEALVKAFEKLVKESAREEEDRLIASEIEYDVLKNFRFRFKEAFLAKAGIRRVFVDCNAYIDESSVLPRIKGELKWGLNTLEDKRFYAENRLETDLGKRQGEHLGNSESLFAFEEVCKLLPNSEVQRGEAIEEVISRGIKELLDSGYVTSAIFMSLKADRHFALESSSLFTPAWKLDLPRQENPACTGHFHFESRKIAAYSVWGASKENCLCILDLPKCMEWVQKSPIDDHSEAGFVENPFSIRIADLAKEDELRNQIISQPPQWLIEQEEPDRYLRMRVWLQIWERFKLTLKQPEAGRKFILPE